MSSTCDPAFDYLQLPQAGTQARRGGQDCARGKATRALCCCALTARLAPQGKMRGVLNCYEAAAAETGAAGLDELDTQARQEQEDLRPYVAFAPRPAEFEWQPAPDRFDAPSARSPPPAQSASAHARSHTEFDGACPRDSAAAATAMPMAEGDNLPPTSHFSVTQTRLPGPTQFAATWH